MKALICFDNIHCFFPSATRIFYKKTVANTHKNIAFFSTV